MRHTVDDAIRAAFKTYGAMNDIQLRQHMKEFGFTWVDYHNRTSVRGLKYEVHGHWRCVWPERRANIKAKLPALRAA